MYGQQKTIWQCWNLLSLTGWSVMQDTVIQQQLNKKYFLYEVKYYLTLVKFVNTKVNLYNFSKFGTV